MEKKCLYPVIPVRSAPSDKAEMVTQMLFGESCIVMQEDQIENFIKVKLCFDDYEGWIDYKQIGDNEDDHQHIVADNNYYLEDAILPFGALVPDKERGNQYTMSNITEVALQYKNTAYLWGGKSNFGIDCSGFTQQVYKICGTSILRDAYQQASQGKKISSDKILPGDLAFYGEGSITHVGIIIEDDKVIHAHGFVRISQFDSKGILNDDTGGHSHVIREYRRFT